MTAGEGSGDAGWQGDIRITKTKSGRVTNDPAGNFDHLYGYAGRILAASKMGGLAGLVQSFSYDGAGRMRTNSRVGDFFLCKR